MQRAQSMSRSILVGCLVGGTALLAGGCSQQVHLGDIGDGAASILWSATFEVGDLSEWEADGHGGTYVDNAPAAPSVNHDLAHRGRYSGLAIFAPLVGVAPAPGFTVNAVTVS